MTAGALRRAIRCLAVQFVARRCFAADSGPPSKCAHHHHHDHQRVCGGERQIRSSSCSQMFTDFDGCSRPATLGVDVGVVPVRRHSARLQRLGQKSARMLSTIPSSAQPDAVCRPITTLLRPYMCACVVAPDHQDWPHDANAPDRGLAAMA